MEQKGPECSGTSLREVIYEDDQYIHAFPTTDEDNEAIENLFIESYIDNPRSIFLDLPPEIFKYT